MWQTATKTMPPEIDRNWSSEIGGLRHWVFRIMYIYIYTGNVDQCGGIPKKTNHVDVQQAILICDDVQHQQLGSSQKCHDMIQHHGK